MNTAENAFILATNIGEDILIDLSTAVDALDALDALDDLHLMMSGTVAEPEEDRNLTNYIVRATQYLEFLRQTIEDGDILAIATMPITEMVTRRRISNVLRASVERKQA